MINLKKLLPIAGSLSVLLFLLPGCSSSDETDTVSKSASDTSGYQVPRNSLGKPDLQGVWDFRTLTPLERPKALGDKAVFSDEEAETFRQTVTAINDTDNKKDLDLPSEIDVEVPYNSFWLDFGDAVGEDRRTSLIVDPANGRLPELTPEAMAGRQNYLLRTLPVREFFSIGLNTFRPVGPESLGLSERCMLGFNAGPPLIPSAYNNNMRIVQTPGYVVLMTEMIHDARIIPMDGSAHLPAAMRRWSGDSRGHWDGDTLVIETRNFTDKTPAYQLPNGNVDDPTQIGALGSGKDMKLTERLTRTGESRLVYEYTLDAPSTFTRPFTVAIEMRPIEDQMYEYACHEGNHAMIGMLRGARMMEKEEANK